MSEFQSGSPALTALRQTMVDCQLRTFDITDRDVLAAAYVVPREAFAPGVDPAVAYSDRMIDIADGKGRSLPAPMVVARLLQAAALTRSDRVLVAASATGYTAALAAQIAARVIALEADTVLASAAAQTFTAIGATNIEVVTAAPAQGYAPGAPYDVIVVDGAIEVAPDALLSQLGEGGRLLAVVLPPGSAGWRGKATMFEKSGGRVGSRVLFDAAAKPLADFCRPEAFVF